MQTPIDAGKCVLRAYELVDRERLAGIANDKGIARNLTDRFAHPYLLEDAQEWIEFCISQGEPIQNFAIVVDGELAGGCGIDLLDGEKSHVANIGYWLGTDYWGRGAATDALVALVEYTLRTFGVQRLQASVYGWNPASSRVLEKAGFVLEGRLVGAVEKFGEATDELIYGLVRPHTNL